MGDKKRIKVEDLILKFADPVWEERKRVSDILAKLGAPVVPYLIEALKNEDENIRYWCIRTLGEIATAEALQAIFAILDEADKKYKLYAIQALKYSRKDAIIKKLINLLGSDDWDLIAASASSLENIGKPTIPFLVDELKTADENLKFWIIKIIAKIDINVLLKFVKYQNRDIRLFITEALGEIRTLTSVKILLHFLSDPYWEVRQNAVDSLIKIGDMVIKPILLFLKGKDIDTYLWAFKVLERVKVRILTPLLEELKKGSRDIKVNVARILGGTGDKRVIPPLFDTLSDNSLFVAKAAANSLVQLAQSSLELSSLIEERCIEDVKRLDVTSNYRYWVMLTLGKIGNQSVRKLLDGLENEEKEVKQQVIKVIGDLKLEEGIDKLIDMLNAPEWPVRKAAADALISFGSRITTYIYIYLVKGNDNIKEWVRKIIKEVGYESTYEFINILKNSEDRDEKIASIIALGLIGNKAAIETLQYVVLNDKDDWIRRYAAEAISQITETEAIPLMIKLLHDRSESLISYAVEFFLKSTSSKAKQMLLEELEKGNISEDKEKYVYLILAGLGEKDSYLPLVDALKSEKEGSMFFETAKKVLPLLGTEIIPYLTEEFSNKNIEVRDKIHDLLVSLGDKVIETLKIIKDNSNNENIKFWVGKTIKHIEGKNKERRRMIGIKK